jgi:preprotein translocase subunit SecE
MKRIIQFFRDSISELKKVSWPSREEVGASTRVVVISVVLFAAILGLVDFLLVTGIDKLFS